MDDWSGCSLGVSRKNFTRLGVALLFWAACGRLLSAPETGMASAPGVDGALGVPWRAAGTAPEIAGAPSPRPHAPVALYTHGDPTAHEQYMLELINRARANPLAEAARLGLDLNDGLEPETITPEPKPPLSFHLQLIAAARAHSDWMLAANEFSHTGADGSTPGDRMRAAGYVFSGNWTWGENIAWQGTTATPDLNAYTADLHDNLFRSPGHRRNLLNPNFDEVGIGIRTGPFASGMTLYNAVMATQNFARSANTPGPLVLGVVYRDANRDGEYTPGEGMAGIAVTPSRGGFFAVTTASGGFAFPAPATSGTLTLTLAGPGLPLPLVRDIPLAAVNVKVDFELNNDQPLGFVPGSAGFDAQKRFRFDLAGPSGARARVERSADARTWEPLGAYTLTNGRVTVTDSSGTAGQRLYRAVLTP